MEKTCEYAYRKNGDVSLHCRYLTEKKARHDWCAHQYLCGRTKSGKFLPNLPTVKSKPSVHSLKPYDLEGVVKSMDRIQITKENLMQMPDYVPLRENAVR